jgi:hypothetical protein
MNDNVRGDLAAASDPVDFPSFVNLAEQSLLNPRWPSNWSVQSTDDPYVDIDRGIALAEEAIRYARDHRSALCIILAIAEIGRRGSLSCVETAFINRLACASSAVATFSNHAVADR